MTTPSTNEIPPPPAILIVCTDLIFSTKITGTAKALGRPFAVARTLEKLEQLLATAAPDPLLIIDLNVTALDPMAAIRLAKSVTPPQKPPRILAFLSHVQVELAAEAKAAGADQVMPRSSFSQQLPSLLARPA